MTTNVLVTFYSTYGHVHRMALAVAEGAESVPDITVRLRRIPELEEARKALSAQDAYVRAQQAQADIPVVTHDDLRWADGIAWGTPTRYGNMTAQMKQFIDTTGGLWAQRRTRGQGHRDFHEHRNHPRPWSLLFAKFFPGLTTISVAMAGVTKMSLPFFLLLNGDIMLHGCASPLMLEAASCHQSEAQPPNLSYSSKLPK
jgi:multimeric flavodoxin WrbA